MLNNTQTKIGVPAYTLAAAAALAPVLAFFEPRWASPLIVAAAVVAFAATLLRKGRLHLPGRPLVVVLVLLCFWAAVTIIWSLDVWIATRGTLKLTGNLLVGVVLLSIAKDLDEGEARIVSFGLLGGFLLTLTALTVEVLFGGPISSRLIGIHPDTALLFGFFWLNSSLAILALTVWPLSVMFLGKLHGSFAGALFVVMVAVAFLIEYVTGMAAVAVGLVTAGIVYRGQGGALRILAGLMVLGLFAAPLLPAKVFEPAAFSKSDLVPRALVHRMYVWDFTAARILEKPFHGWGMSASRVIPEGKEYAVDPRYGTIGDKLPLHPHNFALQAWLELGLPGALLFAAFGALVLLGIAGSGKGRRVMALQAGHFAAGLFLITFGFGVWQSWGQASLWLSAAMMVAASRARARTDTGEED